MLSRDGLRGAGVPSGSTMSRLSPSRYSQNLCAGRVFFIVRRAPGSVTAKTPIPRKTANGSSSSMSCSIGTPKVRAHGSERRKNAVHIDRARARFLSCLRCSNSFLREPVARHTFGGMRNDASLLRNGDSALHLLRAFGGCRPGKSLVCSALCAGYFGLRVFRQPVRGQDVKDYSGGG